MKPVFRKYCQYHELFDGTYDIDQIADLNDMIDVADADSANYNKAIEKKR